MIDPFMEPVEPNCPTIDLMYKFIPMLETIISSPLADINMERMRKMTIAKEVVGILMYLKWPNAKLSCPDSGLGVRGMQFRGANVGAKLTRGF
jgi:hypothetical protein